MKFLLLLADPSSQWIADRQFARQGTKSQQMTAM
jgi:hypothetical protein